MGLFSSFRGGWKLLQDSFKILLSKPIFLLPLFVSWIVFAGVVLYLRYYFVSSSNLWLNIFYVFLFLFLITFVICLANIVMLELMQQIESGKKMSLSKALKEAFILDFFKIIPIAIIWAAIWVIILLIKAMTRSRGRKGEPSARDAARTLGGANSGPFSWLRLGLDMIEKLVRMVVFLSLPAIAWENKGSFSSFGQAFKIIKKHPVQFTSTYTLTGVAALIMALPLVPIFYMDKFGFEFSALFWTVVIIYECIIWTLGIYLEQMSVSLLYLWHLKWKRNGATGDLSSISRPDLLDDEYELG